MNGSKKSSVFSFDSLRGLAAPSENVWSVSDQFSGHLISVWSVPDQALIRLWLGQLGFSTRAMMTAYLQHFTNIRRLSEKQAIWWFTKSVLICPKEQSKRQLWERRRWTAKPQRPSSSWPHSVQLLWGTAPVCGSGSKVRCIPGVSGPSRRWPRRIRSKRASGSSARKAIEELREHRAPIRSIPRRLLQAVLPTVRQSHRAGKQNAKFSGC